MELAQGRCEYCHAPQEACGYPFHLEHVIPDCHDGPDELPNRALACSSCNLAKGVREKGIDADTGEEVVLFHPRTQDWEDHFCWGEDEITIVGLSPVGRVTVELLDMNNALRLQARRWWLQFGLLP